MCIRGFSDAALKDATNPAAQIGVCALAAFKNYADYNAGKTDAAVAPEAAGEKAKTDADLDAAITKDSAAVEKTAAADKDDKAKIEDPAPIESDKEVKAAGEASPPTDAEAQEAAADKPARMEDDDEDSDSDDAAERKERGLISWIKDKYKKVKDWLGKNLPGLKKLGGYIAKLFNKAVIHAIIDFAKCVKPAVSELLNKEFGGAKSDKNTLAKVSSDTVGKLLEKLPSILKAGWSMIKSLVAAAKEKERTKKWEKYGNAAGVAFNAIIEALKKKKSF